MTQGRKIVMSFRGHWNGKFPFIPPSAFPGEPVHVSWPSHCRLTDGTTTTPRDLLGCTQQHPTNPGASPASGLQGAALLGAELLPFPGACAMQGSTTFAQWALPPDGCHSQVWKEQSWGSATLCVTEPVLHLHPCLHCIPGAHQELRGIRGRASPPWS